MIFVHFKNAARRNLPPLLFFVGFIFLIAVLGGSIRIDCAQRNSSEPTAPIYPNSVLLGRNTSWYESATKIRYEYETQDAPSQVWDFYNGQAACDAIEGTQTFCDGDANPFGKYMVFISLTNPTTTYAVEVRWDKCGSDWAISVE